MGINRENLYKYLNIEPGTQYVCTHTQRERGKKGGREGGLLFREIFYEKFTHEVLPGGLFPVFVSSDFSIMCLTYVLKFKKSMNKQCSQ